MERVFLTGGRGNIGNAIRAKFELEGYEVISPSSSELNLLDQANISSYIENIPQVAAVIHCAGINNPVAFENLEFDNFEKTLNINAISFFKIMSEMITNNKLKERGHVLAISSIYGEISRKGRFAYTASKYCLNGMVKNLAIELAPKKIKVNGLAPGFVDTQLTYKNNSEEMIQKIKRSIPLGELAKVDDIAKVAYFLASTNNNYITGQIVFADGGYVIGGGDI
jgi:3-oxoacyl-[acyl-carrier protein] reductase